MRLAFALVASLPALTALPALSQQPQFIQVTYTCERGVTVPVVYVNGPGDAASAVAQIEGQLRVLQIARSASGARYREGAAGYQIWGKGDQATISYGTDADEITLYADCHAGTPDPAP